MHMNRGAGRESCGLVSDADFDIIEHYDEALQRRVCGCVYLVQRLFTLAFDTSLSHCLVFGGGGAGCLLRPALGLALLASDAERRSWWL